MAERRPAGISTGSWIDQQIQAAQAAGAFDDLPGAGKPIPDLHVRDSELDYVAKVVKRESLDPLSFLPPSLALARELEQLEDKLRAFHCEKHVRDYVEDFNSRVDKAVRGPAAGPPVRVRHQDVDHVLETWRSLQQTAVPEPPVAPAPQPRRRRWFRGA